jgi:hypothetical protein
MRVDDLAGSVWAGCGCPHLVPLQQLHHQLAHVCTVQRWVRRERPGQPPRHALQLAQVVIALRIGWEGGRRNEDRTQERRVKTAVQCQEKWGEEKERGS